MQSDEFEYADLVLSVLLDEDFARGLAARGHGEVEALTERLEERLQEQYPGASVSVRVQEGLEGHWTVQAAEVGDAGLADFVRGDLHLHLADLLSSPAPL